MASRVHESVSTLGDMKDEEIGLLSGQVKFNSVTAPFENVGRRPLWVMVVMNLLVVVGLLAMILAITHIEDHRGAFTYSARRGDPMAPLNVLVVGDWGRQGQYNQSAVAEQMGRIGAELDARFIISTGDNFYNWGLDDVNDPLFEESFSQIYQATSLQKTWYAVLGNHDYRGNPDAQVDRRLRDRDSRWHCNYEFFLRVDLDHAGNDELGRRTKSAVEFFFIDTSPFVEDYWTPLDAKYEWTRSRERDLVNTKHLMSLSKSLKASNATWKVVVGHHTILSYGHHGRTQELINKILPILNANNVDLYLNGHDHCLQHIKPVDSDIHFVTSGGGSKAWRFDGEVPSQTPERQDLKLYYDGQGFVALSVSPSTLIVNFYDITGSIIHQIHLTK